MSAFVMNPLPKRYIAIIEREARRLGETCSGDVLVSEILAFLIEHEEPVYRALCNRARDPGEVLKTLLPPDVS